MLLNTVARATTAPHSLRTCAYAACCRIVVRVIIYCMPDNTIRVRALQYSSGHNSSSNPIPVFFRCAPFVVQPNARAHATNVLPHIHSRIRHRDRAKSRATLLSTSTSREYARCTFTHTHAYAQISDLIVYVCVYVLMVDQSTRRTNASCSCDCAHISAHIVYDAHTRAQPARLRVDHTNAAALHAALFSAYISQWNGPIPYQSLLRDHTLQTVPSNTAQIYFIIHVNPYKTTIHTQCSSL